MSSVSGADALVVAVDQGTSSTKAIVVDASGSIVASATVPLSQSHPRQGWVEQDASEIFASVVTAIGDALAGATGTVASVGVSSQRESAVAWDAATGQPLGPVLGWQDRRTAATAQALTAAGHGDAVRATTGLPIDPMFSALKFAWLLDQVDPDRSRSRAGQIALGTVDSWIVTRLTGEHRIETGNASRTLLLDLTTGDWDDAMLALFDIPREALPRVAASNEPSSAVVGIEALGAGVTIGGVLADSHAALYGHGVREPGAVKVTYGTGSSVLGLLADGREPGAGLVRTVAWDIGSPVLAAEGNILSAGATLVWLSSVLSVEPSRLAAVAASTDDSDGVVLVPAFAGLGAPWWDDHAQGLITGLTLGTTADHLARAAFESIVFQVEDVLAAMDSGSGPGGRINTILADGGPAANAWLMQLQSDVSQRAVRVPASAGLSALGAAYLAGCTAGVWDDQQVQSFAAGSSEYTAQISASDAATKHHRWSAAVARSRGIAALPPATEQ